MRSARSRDTAYEIQGFARNHWSVLDILDTKEEALEEARRRFRTGGQEAVRVLRERHDEASGEWRAFEIAFFGRRRKPSRYDGELPAVSCRNVDDLYDALGRREATRLLGPQLEAWGLTTIEILYDLDNYSRLANAGTVLQNAVQRAAMASARATGQPVSACIRHLYGLIDEAVSLLRATADNGPLPALAELDFSEAVARVENRPDRERRLCMMLAAELRDQEGPRARLARLLSWLGAQARDWVEPVLDLFIAEQLQHRSLVQALLPAEHRAGRVLLLAGLVRGACEAVETGVAGDELRRLDALLGEERLPEARAVLLEHIREEIEAGGRLASETLDGECAALARLAARLGDMLDHEGSGLDEAMKARQARLINPQAIGDHLAGAADPLQKLVRLLDLERHLLGEASRRAVASYILPLLDAPSNETFWLDTSKGMSSRGRMQMLVRLAGRIAASNLPETARERAEARLDALCCKLIESSRILARLAAAPSTPSEKAARVLAMLKDGCFTAGAARAAAESEVRRYLRDPALLAPVAAAGTPDERKAVAKRIERLLAEAGMSGLAP